MSASEKPSAAGLPVIGDAASQAGMLVSLLFWNEDGVSEEHAMRP